MSCLHVHFLPSLVEPDALRSSTVVVIDVLRATTTIAAAIAAGAREIIPCGKIEEAKAVADRFAPGEAVLGGERGGLPIPGFDLGNSPSEYTPERVGGKSVVFTTTNGTQAMLRCRQAGRVVTAGFVNVSAIERTLTDAERVDFLCAGTRGLITREDTLLAGCLLERLRTARAGPTSRVEVNDSGQLALDAWEGVCSRTVRHGVAEVWEGMLRESLAGSQGGRDLFPLDLGQDVLDAAKVDRWSCVPELDIARWSIRDSAK